MRCDRVAEGVVEAYRTIGKIEIPVIVRLQGTNAEEAKVLIDEVLKENPKDSSALLLKGRLAMQEKDYADAVAAFRSVLKAQPDISFTFFSSRDVVRHPLVQQIINAYDAYDRSSTDDS